MLSAEGSDKITNLDDLLRIETYGRLVENKDLGVTNKCLSDTYSLAVALGEILDNSLFNVCKTGNLEDLLKMLFAVELTAFKIVHEAEIFEHRHITVKRGLLGEKADILLYLIGLFGNIHSVFRIRSV